MSELSSTINQLQSDVSQLNGGQATVNGSLSSNGSIVQYAVCFQSHAYEPSYHFSGGVASLVDCVNYSIANGWVPLGGFHDYAQAWAQSLVKYSE